MNVITCDFCGKSSKGQSVEYKQYEHLDEWVHHDVCITCLGRIIKLLKVLRQDYEARELTQQQ
jgi:hypothetical protein